MTTRNAQDGMPDFTTMGDGQIIGICGDDAKKWAAAFCQHAKNWGYDFNADLLVGWFANAIETADSIRRHRSKPPTNSAYVPMLRR